MVNPNSFNSATATTTTTTATGEDESSSSSLQECSQDPDVDNDDPGSRREESDDEDEDKDDLEADRSSSDVVVNLIQETQDVLAPPPPPITNDNVTNDTNGTSKLPSAVTVAASSSAAVAVTATTAPTAYTPTTSTLTTSVTPGPTTNFPQSSSLQEPGASMTQSVLGKVESDFEQLKKHIGNKKLSKETLAKMKNLQKMVEDTKQRLTSEREAELALMRAKILSPLLDSMSKTNIQGGSNSFITTAAPTPPSTNVSSTGTAVSNTGSSSASTSTTSTASSSSSSCWTYGATGGGGSLFVNNHGSSTIRMQHVFPQLPQSVLQSMHTRLLNTLAQVRPTTTTTSSNINLGLIPSTAAVTNSSSGSAAGGAHLGLPPPLNTSTFNALAQQKPTTTTSTSISNMGPAFVTAAGIPNTSTALQTAAAGLLNGLPPINPTTFPGTFLQWLSQHHHRGHSLQIPSSSSSSSDDFDSAPNLPPSVNHLNLNTNHLLSAQPPTPPNWTISYEQALETATSFLRVPIPESSEEFRVLSGLLVPSSQCIITAASRIINPELWKRFKSTRKKLLLNKSTDLQLLASLGLSEAELERKAKVNSSFKSNPDVSSSSTPYSDNIALLWHGCRTPGSIDTVLSEGLDERLGSVGHLGRGIYFSDDPKKAMQYDRNGHTLLLFGVILGDCLAVDHLSSCKKHNLVREPPKSAKEQRTHLDLFFDSIVGRPGSSPVPGSTGPNEFVVYNRHQVVPLYAIEYQKNVVLKAAARVEGFDMYRASREELPWFAWMPTSVRNELLSVGPAVPFQFYARNLFELMEGSGAADFIVNIKQESLDRISLKQKAELDAKLRVLNELGFLNDVKNKECLLKYDGDLNATAAYLLDARALLTLTDNNSNVTATASGTATTKTNTSPNFTAPVVTSITAATAPSSSATALNSATNPPTLSPPKRPRLDATATNSSTPTATVPVLASVSSIKSMLEKSAQEYENLIRKSPSGRTTSSAQSSSQVPVAAPTLAPANLNQEEEECPICTVEYPTNDSSSWKVLSCSHKICSTCFTKIQTTRTTMSGKTCTFFKCPFCCICPADGGIEIGDCPDGSMNVEILLGVSVSGYEAYNTIKIQYIVPATWTPTGRVSLNRTAYLPNSRDGAHVLSLLEIAWDRRLTFTIGTSHTTGASNVLVWNIHHKTNMNGGVGCYGYPDPSYLSRVQDELKQYKIE